MKTIKLAAFLVPVLLTVAAQSKEKQVSYGWSCDNGLSVNTTRINGAMLGSATYNNGQYEDIRFSRRCPNDKDPKGTIPTSVVSTFVNEDKSFVLKEVQTLSGTIYTLHIKNRPLVTGFRCAPSTSIASSTLKCPKSNPENSGSGE